MIYFLNFRLEAPLLWAEFYSELAQPEDLRRAVGAASLFWQ